MARYINPATRQLEIDAATGHFKSMPKIRQRVLIIMMTVRGSSSAIPQFGLSHPDKIQANKIRAQMRAEVDRAFHRMVNVERSIRIDDLVIEEGDFGRVALTLVYTDLTTRQADQRVTV